MEPVSEAAQRHKPHGADVKSTVRTLLVLETLADGIGRSLTELSTTLGLPKSSLHAILQTMLARDWLAFDVTRTLYTLGVRALVTGHAYLAGDDIVQVADRALDALGNALDETIHLGRLTGSDIVYLAKRESSHPLRLVSAVGRRLPAHTTALGKVLLAELADETAFAQLTWPLVSMTPKTITTRAALKDALEAIREQGYAIDDDESTRGVRCFAVPIRTSTPALYAISCSIPEARMNSALEQIVLRELRTARDSIESWINHDTTVSPKSTSSATNVGSE